MNDSYCYNYHNIDTTDVIHIMTTAQLQILIGSCLLLSVTPEFLVWLYSRTDTGPEDTT